MRTTTRTTTKMMIVLAAAGASLLASPQQIPVSASFGAAPAAAGSGASGTAGFGGGGASAAPAAVNPTAPIPPGAAPQAGTTPRAIPVQPSMDPFGPSPEGSLAIPATPGAPGADPFIRPGTAALGGMGAGGEMRAEDLTGMAMISTRLEVFSLELKDAAALLRSGSDGPELYAKVVEMVDKNAAIQEALMTVKTRAGERSLIESISEQIYPTEYTGPWVVKPGAKPGDHGITTNTPFQEAAVPATPVAFETRNVGWTMEIAPGLSSDGRKVDLRIAPNYTVRAGDSHHGQGLSETTMPTFETQRLDTAVTAKVGEPYFMGTMNRTRESTVVAPEVAKRIWLAFVTANASQP